jgi:succinoglycan biosynthesis protein ExoA
MNGVIGLTPLDPGTAVSVIIPARDAAALLPDCLGAVVPQLRTEDELVVAAADAATAAAANVIAAGDPRIRVVANPAATTPAALNAAIAATRHPVIIRIDAQSTAPVGYRDAVVELLVRTGASNVGGLQVATADPDGPAFQRAVAAAMNSPLGHGGAAYRAGGAGPVDTVYLGAFRREAIVAVGGYDERFTTNQDAELNERLRRAGGTVWLDPALTVAYRPRRTPRALARQFLGYGRGRARTARAHRGSLRLRQIAAPLLVLALAGGLAVALVGALTGAADRTLVPLALTVGGYGVRVAVGVMLSGSAARRQPVLVASAVMIMHLAWGLGFLAGLVGPGTGPRGAAQAEARDKQGER